MSRQTALDNIHLKLMDRWAHTEYSITYHADYLARAAGVEKGRPDLARLGHDALQLDFIWSTNDGPVNWFKQGRATDMGHAAYDAAGSDQSAPVTCPFNDAEEVWAFDAVSEYGLPAFEDLVSLYRRLDGEYRAAFPNQLTTGGYYKTIVSGAIQAFGWDMLLLAASEPERMEKVLDSFFRRTLFHMQAWARTDIEVVIQHDDFVWANGPFLSPDYVRSAIIARYAELWKPLHAAGKKVLFCSDGDFSLFVDDLAAAGADGFIFEPCVDFGMMVERFGTSHCLVGSYVDCRDLTFGLWDKVAQDIDRTFKALERCKGAIVAVGNHLPANIPEAMLDRYFAAVQPRLARRIPSSSC